MSGDVAHIAIVSPNAAFSAFAESVLASWPDLSVYAFADVASLTAAGIQPAVVACNFEFDSGFYEALGPTLRALRLRGPLVTLAIVRHLDGWTRTRCRTSGIDEVVVKPISPLHLGLRLAALANASPGGALPHSAEILPFPLRRRLRRVADLHPGAS